MIKFLFSRYITYGIIFLEVLLVPVYLKKSDYVQYEYVKNLINLSSFVLLGSHTGFVYYFYSKKENHFPELFKVSIYILLLTSLFFSVFYQSLFLLFPFLCYGMSVFLEKKLQVEKEFYVAILYKPLLALNLIFAVLGYCFILGNEVNIYVILSIGYSLSLFLWFIVIKFFAKKSFREIESVRLRLTVDDVKTFYRLVKVGIVENAATVILMFYLFTDRYVLNHFYQDQLPSYSLAFNFSQFVFIGINSLAYIQNVEIGENLDTLNRDRILKILRKSFLFFLILFIGVLLLSFIYGKVFPVFQDLIKYTFILSFFIGIFYTCNVLSVIPLFKGKQKVITIGLALVGVINVILSYSFYQFNIPPILNIGKTALLLMLFGAYLVGYSIKLTNRKSA